MTKREDGLRTVARLLWCESATLAIVLTGDIPLWLAVLVMTLIPVFGLAPPEAEWVARVRRLSSFLTGAYLFFFPFDWIHLSGRLIFATVHLMFYLKLHTLLHQRSARERGRLHLICLFEMLAAASMTVDASFLAPLGVFVVLGTLVLLLEQVRPARVEPAGFRAAVSTAFGLSVPLLLLAGVVFVTLPRTSSGGFRLGGVTGITTTGFSEQVRLGDFEEIKRSQDVVMRILASDENSPPRWRGPAYDRYENGEWLQTLSGVSALPRAPGGGFRLNRDSDDPTTRTDVFLEPLDTDVLFLPPASSRIAATDRSVFVDPYWTLRTGRSRRAGRHYVVHWHSSWPSDASSIGPTRGVAHMSPDRRELYTQLPELSERFEELSARVAEPGGLEPLELARAVARHLESSYGYTLVAPPRGRGDPVEDFLFGARAGHCEYFATAMVLLMRSHGVPARLVTGFNRGDRNAVGDFEIVRRSNAHAWVEVFDEEASWVAFDPTPPSLDTTAAAATGFLSAGIESLRMLWDMYVVAFDLERQRGVLGAVARLAAGVKAWLAEVVGRALDHVRALGAIVLGALGLFLLSRASWVRGLRFGGPGWRLLRSSRRAGRGPGFYETLLARLERLGIERRAAETPAEFARAWEEHLPGLVEVTNIYYRVRFGGERLDPAEARRAERLASAICLAAIGDGRRSP